MPLTVWGLWLTAILNVLFVPVLGSAALLLTLDRAFGTEFLVAGALAGANAGDPIFYLSVTLITLVFMLQVVVGYAGQHRRLYDPQHLFRGPTARRAKRGARGPDPGPPLLRSPLLQLPRHGRRRPRTSFPGTEPGPRDLRTAMYKFSWVTGKDLYHTDGNCWKCHAAFATREYIYEKAQARDVKPSFTDDMYDSKLQEETHFVANGAKVDVLPPDYTFGELRVSHDVEGIYKTIRGGIGGGLMPAHDNFPEEDILAIAHYVNSLVELGKNDVPGAHKLRDDLRASLATAWVAPVAEEEEGEDSGEPSEGAP